MTAHQVVRRHLVLALLLAAGIVVSSCGVPLSAAPRSIPRQQVPFHLLSPTTSTTTPRAGLPVLIYLATSDTQQLSEVARAVPFTSNRNELLSSIIDSLVKGPQPSELKEGLVSDIPPQVNLISTTVTGSLAKLNFSSNFSKIPGAESVLEVAQVVYSATQDGTGVLSVQFEIAGDPIAVPTQTASQTQSRVGRAQYASLT